MDERERHRRGTKVRRAVLGAAHVARARRAASEFDAELQDLITRYAWGELWTRPGLPRKLRSLITLAMLVAMARPHEIAVHVRGAINNGVSKEELSELMLHSIIYCGIPKAVEGFRTAQGVLKDMGLE